MRKVFITAGKVVALSEVGSALSDVTFNSAASVFITNDSTLIEVGSGYDGSTFTAPPPHVPTVSELAVIAKSIKEAADTTNAKADAKLMAFAAMTPAQVRTWVAANVATLADAKDALATLAVAVSILARRL